MSGDDLRPEEARAYAARTRRTTPNAELLRAAPGGNADARHDPVHRPVARATGGAQPPASRSGGKALLRELRDAALLPIRSTSSIDEASRGEDPCISSLRIIPNLAAQVRQTESGCSV